jgi:hypothetical protein
VSVSVCVVCVFDRRQSSILSAEGDLDILGRQSTHAQPHTHTPDARTLLSPPSDFLLCRQIFFARMALDSCRRMQQLITSHYVYPQFVDVRSGPVTLRTPSLAAADY